MFAVRFVGTPGRYGPFRDEATARWWAKHEADGRQISIIPVTPTP